MFPDTGFMSPGKFAMADLLPVSNFKQVAAERGHQFILATAYSLRGLAYWLRGLVDRLQGFAVR